MIKIKFCSDCDHEKLAEFLTFLAASINEYKEENQLVAIAQLDEKVKIAYVKIVVNMTFDDDGEIDEKEFSEIFQLISRINLAPESRYIIRSYMAEEEKLVPLEELLQELDRECPDSQLKPMRISLVNGVAPTKPDTHSFAMSG